MNKRTFLIIGAIAALVLTAAGGWYLWDKSRKASLGNELAQLEESVVRQVVENFGQSLKNVSLLSPTAAQEIEQNYKPYLTPDLLEQWKNEPEQALGREVSSPWPDRIEIESLTKVSDNQYRVSGKIVEVSNQEQGSAAAAAKRAITLIVAEFNSQWLISQANAGEYEASSGLWQTATDPGQGIEYQYPEQIIASYIFAQDWPPVVELKIAQFSCAEPLRRVADREYCVGTENEGAAGSVYSAYTYNTMRNDKMATIRFTLRYPQCQNYAEPQQSECLSEREAFDLNGLVDRIVQSIKEI